MGRRPRIRVHEDTLGVGRPAQHLRSEPGGRLNQRRPWTRRALAALHGVNNNAEKISITRSDDGNVTVTAKYRKTDLPSPGAEVAEKIIAAVAEIAHIEGDKGKTLLALGIRDSSIDLNVKLKTKDGGKKVTLKFPE